MKLRVTSYRVTGYGLRVRYSRKLVNRVQRKLELGVQSTKLEVQRTKLKGASLFKKVLNKLAEL